MNQNRGKQQFEIMLQQVYDAITVMMMEGDEHLVLIQGACLKYLPTTIADIITVFEPQEFRSVNAE